ncbi:SLATT domain-containing protein [Mumia sp. DW29H23]|uniref:SLATT domain-containing protein n=1 Tax=Mumia sp. DW29H23 TaxID=3421241 RepID=UPI003D684FAA
MWTYRGDEPTVLQWLDSISVGHEAHQIAAKATRRRHRVLGATTVMLAGLAAAAAFAAVLGEPRPWLQVCAGVLAALAATSALLHTVADDADVIAAHQRSGAEYGNLRRQLEQAILSERITDDRLSEIRAEWTRVEEAAPSLPARTTRAAEHRLAATAPAAAPAVPTVVPTAPVAPSTTTVAAAEPLELESADEPTKELTTS